MKVERVCIVCGSIFAAWPYSIKKGQAKYCSRTCFHKRNKKQTCSVPGCNKPATSLGMCKKHYTRFSRYGHTDKQSFQGESLEKKLSRFTVNEKTNCWEWTGNKSNSGYGTFAHEGKKLYAHRESFKFHNGPIKKCLYVLHKCDNKLCMNPDHLFVGSAKDNSEDMMKKGRQAKGADRQPKLTKSQVLELRTLSESRKLSAPALARKFSVSLPTVHSILAKKTWKHI